MKLLRPSSNLAVFFCLFLLGGCGSATRNSVQVRPQQTTSTPAAPQEPLPIEPRRAHTLPLTPEPRAAADFLLEKVEAAFHAGEQNYRAGHLEKARRDFDRALDWLLGSGIDPHSDARLERLYERIVDTVHAYEVAALREGDGFTEQRGEPAAIDEIAELTFPVDPRLREKVENELRTIPHDLPLTVNDTVLSYLNFFQTPRGRAIVETGLRRAGQYREMILRILAEEGLPQDLIYLAQAESAFRPLAVSRARARGIWQFMSFRGEEYGLNRTWWIDERLDPEKSTRAAARHLRDLYQQFGDWYLAMAAYNSGPGNVTRAIERTGYADFWELHRRNVLPRETRNYVPIILALTLITKDAEHYGLRAEPELPVRTERVRPGHPIDLRLVAETVDESLQTIKTLNPQLLRMVTPPDPDFELHLPEGSAERFFAEIAAIPPEKWVSWRWHRVESGESLSSIAQKHRVTSRAIAEANGMDEQAPLMIGTKLIIPAVAAAPTGQGTLTHYRVRRGDTLSSIARQFSVSVQELRRWNGIRSDRVARGTRLKVYPGGRSAPVSRASGGQKGAANLARNEPTSPSSDAEPVVHRVRQGETLWSIARTYQTTVEALRAANRFLARRQLQVGDLLMILPSR